MTLQDQINELSKLIQTKNIKEPDHQPLKNDVIEKKITYKQRWFWSAIIFVATQIPFWIHYFMQSEWTFVTFTFMMLGIILPMLVFIDVKFTNGDSFDKISENGIALSISLFALVYLFVGLLQYGEKFSPERIKGEALQRIESQIGELQQRLNTEAPAKDSIQTWDEGATR